MTVWGKLFSSKVSVHTQKSNQSTDKSYLKVVPPCAGVSKICDTHWQL